MSSSKGKGIALTSSDCENNKGKGIAWTSSDGEQNKAVARGFLSLAMSSSKKIVLTSCDGVSFEIDEEVAREFQILAHIIEDDCAGQAIPLQNITGEILEMVIEYVTKHVEAGPIEDDDEEETKKKELDSWDEEFMKLDLDTIFELINAANYLNIKSLLDLTSQTVADFIKDKKVEEVREIFNVENDYTPEEEAALRKEYAWTFE